MFQLKLFRYLINENVLPNFKNINKKKIILYLDDLIELRNSIFHQVYKKDDYKIKQYSKKQNKSQYYQKNKLRNYNFIKKNVDKSIYILKEIFKIRADISHNLNINILKRNYGGLLNIKKNLDDLCIIKERRKRLVKELKTKKQTINLAKKTLDYLNKKLNSKNKATSEMTGRNIVNLITSRLTNDDLFIKEFGNKISNKTCKSYCNDISFYFNWLIFGFFNNNLQKIHKN